jgi:hypothetical protein
MIARWFLLLTSAVCIHMYVLCDLLRSCEKSLYATRMEILKLPSILVARLINSPELHGYRANGKSVSQSARLGVICSWHARSAVFVV